MASKTNCKKNGKDYYRITRTIGHRLNAAGNEVPVRKDFYGKSKKEAEALYQEFVDRQKAGLESKKQYFGIMAENWIDTFLVNEAKLKAGTKDLYINTWRKYVPTSDFYNLPVEDVSAGTIQRFYNSLDASGNVIATINKVMSRFYKYLVQEGYAAHNITDSLTWKKSREKKAEDIVIWTEEELDTILHSFDMAQEGFRLRFLIVLAAYTGMREGELIGLKYSDIDTKKKCLYVRQQVINKPIFKKGEKTEYKLEIAELKSDSSYRTIPLCDDILQELKRHRVSHWEEQLKEGYRTEYVFTTNSGKLYNKKNLSRACKRYYARIGVSAKCFHTYRHTFGTMLCKRGVPIQTASVLLGHSNINITAKYYVNVSHDEKMQAVNVLAGLI